MKGTATVLALCTIPATAAADMRGEIVCGIPPEQEVAYVYEPRPGSWEFIGIGGNPVHRWHPSPEAAVADHAGEGGARYVCDVEIREDFSTVRARLYRVLGGFPPDHWFRDPRVDIVGVASTAEAETDAGPTGFCGIPLSEATVVIERWGSRNEIHAAYGPYPIFAGPDNPPLEFSVAYAMARGAGVNESRFPDYFWAHFRPVDGGRREFAPTADDADCRFRLVLDSDSGTYPVTVLVFRLGQPLKEGELDAQSFYAELRAEKVAQYWGRP